MATFPIEQLTSTVEGKKSNYYKVLMSCYTTGDTGDIAKYDWDGTPSNIIPKTNCSYLINITATARDSSGYTCIFDTSSIEPYFCILKNTGSTNTIVVSKSLGIDSFSSEISVGSISSQLNLLETELEIICTGEASRNIYWTLVLDILEIES